MTDHDLPALARRGRQLTNRIARSETAARLYGVERDGIIQRLRDAGWTQRQIADALGISRGRVAQRL